jgi:hypothetical protein
MPEWRGPVECPVRSPDHTLLDFFFGDIINPSFFSTNLEILVS